jgi:hypothetical protein
LKEPKLPFASSVHLPISSSSSSSSSFPFQMQDLIGIVFFFSLFYLRSIADVASRLGTKIAVTVRVLFETLVFPSWIFFFCLVSRMVVSNDVQRLGRIKKSGLSRMNVA